MSIKVKNAGAYTSIRNIYQKYAGTYHLSAGAWTKVGGVYVPTGIIFQNFDYLAVTGSSTTAYTFASNDAPAFTGERLQLHAGRAQFCAQGIDLPVLVNAAVSGATIEALDAIMATKLLQMNAAEIIARGKKIGFIINIGSNNVQLTTFAAMTQASKDSMAAGLASIVSKILAVGGVPIMGSTNPRQDAFGISVMANYRVWNDQFFIPIARQLTPDYVPLVNGVPTPLYDLQTLYEQQVPLHSDWFCGDYVHPGVSAMPSIREYTGKQLRLLASVPKLTRRKSVVVAGGYQSWYNYGGINIITFSTKTLTTVYDREGNVIPNATFVSTHTGAGAGATSRGNPGEWTVGWENHNCQSGFVYTVNAPHTCTLTLGTPYANKTGTLIITYNTTNNRESKFTSNGVDVYLNGYMGGATTGIIKVEVPFITDAAGVHVLTVDKGTVDAYAMWSALEYVFDWLYV
jgi:hypothetical protein